MACDDPIASPHDLLVRVYDFGAGDWPTPTINSNVQFLTFTLDGRSIGKVAQQIRAASNYWRQKSRFNWRFNNLNLTQVKAFVIWASANRGIQVTMMDQFGDLYTGLIAANPKFKCIHWEASTDTCEDDGGIWEADIVFEQHGGD